MALFGFLTGKDLQKKKEEILDDIESQIKYVADNIDEAFAEPEPVPYNEQIKTAVKTKRGLYPPEVVCIHFCSKHPKKDGSYPKWYWTSYGIKDPARFYEHLERREVIEKGEDGKWKPTEKGEQELEDNRHLLWAHQNNFDTWWFAKQAENIKGENWKDKVRGVLWNKMKSEQDEVNAEIARDKKVFKVNTLPDESLDYYERELNERLRVDYYHMMEFEKKYGDANLGKKYEQTVKALDKKLGR